LRVIGVHRPDAPNYEQFMHSIAALLPVSWNDHVPVGLGNLRNTCYLNSILQYFYTVKDVRDLVLNLETPDLPVTQPELEALVAEVPDLEPGRALVGSQCRFDWLASSEVVLRSKLTLFRFSREGVAEPFPKSSKCRGNSHHSASTTGKCGLAKA
jgi:hypothetical protein